MIQNMLSAIFGSKQERDLKELLPLLAKINALEDWAISLSETQFPEITQDFRERISKGESLENLLPEAFAIAREAARRTLGERPYDVQILGGIVLHQGKIMEMKTGEGKTLSSVAAAYLNSLEGKGVHVVTVNDYLAQRDAAWMKPVFSYLGISVGYIQAQMDVEARKKAYACDITYGTNNEFGFDYLRDNMRWDIKSKSQPIHNYCIIDEIDSILIDEARTPLIISGPAGDDTEKYTIGKRIAPSLEECAKDPETDDYPEEPEGDFKIDEKGRRILFTDQGMNKIEELLQKQKVITGSLFTDENFEYIHYITQSLKAMHLFKRDVHYVVKEGQVQIVDEFTGRILYGRRYSEGLHQAIEAKEGIKVARQNKTLATITFQNFFRMYNKISGMTGTADTEAKEFGSIYNLDVVVIPTNRPVARLDEDDVIFITEQDKFHAICDEIQEMNEKGTPMLVGTVSIEKSELLSNMLKKRGIKHEILNAKNHAREALIIAEAGAKGAVTIATNMAGRGTDIKLGGNPEYRARKRAGTEATEEEFKKAYEIEYKKWLEDADEVRRVGGLYVLGTERHESRRIDNQLRGRSGRQGDPGMSRFFISLDDDLMRLFGGDRLKGIMSKAGMGPGEPVYHPLINKSIENAQRKVEDRNFDIRKHLLEFDDVLNEQRKFIYEQRDSILQDKNLKARIIKTAGEIIDDLWEDYIQAKGHDKTASLEHLLNELKVNFFYEPDEKTEELTLLPEDELRAMILEDLEKDILEKEQSLGPEALNHYIRFEYLRHIDQRWQEHLENLEALREAVYLRSYAQKNPLLEYKLEGFKIFDTLLYNIRTAIAKKLFKITIEKKDGRNLLYEKAPVGTATHKNLGQFSGATRGGERREARPKAVQVKRTQPKVKRNEPCPCGSGKKYKHCCGR
ncbi:MAG: preprotein translocase subunit SecA [Spirochaetia bacterium]